MLLGKYARKPAIPFLSALAMLGYGIAGAVGALSRPSRCATSIRAWPFRGCRAWRWCSPRSGMISAERHAGRLAAKPASTAPPARSFGTVQQAGAAMFALGDDRAGARLSTAFRAAKRAALSEFAKPPDLQWLMPVFWIGFNIAMFPAGAITKRVGGYAVMGAARR